MTSNQRVITTTTTTTIIIIISHGPPRERSKKAPILWIIFGVLPARRPTCHFSFWGGGAPSMTLGIFSMNYSALLFIIVLSFLRRTCSFLAPSPKKFERAIFLGLKRNENVGENLWNIIINRGIFLADECPGVAYGIKCNFIISKYGKVEERKR